LQPGYQPINPSVRLEAPEPQRHQTPDGTAVGVCHLKRLHLRKCRVELMDLFSTYQIMGFNMNKKECNFLAQSCAIGWVDVRDGASFP